MSLTSVWAKWEEWNSAFRTWFPHVKSGSPLGDHIEVIFGKGSLRMSVVVPRQNTLVLSRERRDTQKSWTCWWQKASWLHGWGSMQWPNGIVGGNIHGWNMVKLLALVGMKTWKGPSACESVPGMFTHPTLDTWPIEAPWSLNPLPNHHKPPAKNWAQVNHEFDWISRIDWARTNQIMHIMRGPPRYGFLPHDYLQHYMA